MRCSIRFTSPQAAAQSTTNLAPPNEMCQGLTDPTTFLPSAELLLFLRFDHHGILAWRNVPDSFLELRRRLRRRARNSLDRATRQRFVDFPRDQAETHFIRDRTCAPRKAPLYFGFRKSYVIETYEREREGGGGYFAFSDRFYLGGYLLARF